MKIITKDEAAEWCRSHNMAINDFGLPAVWDIPEATDFQVPPDAGQRTALAREQIGKLVVNGSCLVWLDDWSVWPTGQWHHLFQRFRLSYGCGDQLIKRPAHVIDKGEMDAAVSIGVYAILMLWDCYVISDTGSWVFYSHDECGRIKN
jgi:hypothetical protein